MYETLKRLYKKTHDVSVLNKAVAKGWITEEEKEQIISEVGDNGNETEN